MNSAPISATNYFEVSGLIKPGRPIRGQKISVTTVRLCADSWLRMSSPALLTTPSVSCALIAPSPRRALAVFWPCAITAPAFSPPLAPSPCPRRARAPSLHLCSRHSMYFLFLFRGGKLTSPPSSCVFCVPTTASPRRVCRALSLSCRHRLHVLALPAPLCRLRCRRRRLHVHTLPCAPSLPRPRGSHARGKLRGPG